MYSTDILTFSLSREKHSTAGSGEWQHLLLPIESEQSGWCLGGGGPFEMLYEQQQQQALKQKSEPGFKEYIGYMLQQVSEQICWLQASFFLCDFKKGLLVLIFWKRLTICLINK